MSIAAGFEDTDVDTTQGYGIVIVALRIREADKLYSPVEAAEVPLVIV